VLIADEQMVLGHSSRNISQQDGARNLLIGIGSGMPDGEACKLVIPKQLLQGSVIGEVLADPATNGTSKSDMSRFGGSGIRMHATRGCSLAWCLVG
jgi:hypothetical protein